MSLALLFFTGVAIGLIMAVPVGPVNLLAISRTLRHGFVAGFVAGLGGMAADTVFAALAAFGITAVADFIEGHERIIQFAGGGLLLVIGVAALFSHPHLARAPEAPVRRGGILRGGLSGFAMTIGNPGAALAMVALFGSLGDIGTLNTSDLSAMFVVAGVAAGSTLWWFLLASLVARLKERLSDAWLTGINRTAGVILIACGAALLIGLAMGVKLI